MWGGGLGEECGEEAWRGEEGGGEGWGSWGKRVDGVLGVESVALGLRMGAGTGVGKGVNRPNLRQPQSQLSSKVCSA